MVDQKVGQRDYLKVAPTVVPMDTLSVVPTAEMMVEMMDDSTAVPTAALMVVLWEGSMAGH